MLIVGCFDLLFVGLLFELFVELFVVYVGAVDGRGGTAPPLTVSLHSFDSI